MILLHIHQRISRDINTILNVLELTSLKNGRNYALNGYFLFIIICCASDTRCKRLREFINGNGG